MNIPNVPRIPTACHCDPGTHQQWNQALENGFDFGLPPKSHPFTSAKYGLFIGALRQQAQSWCNHCFAFQWKVGETKPTTATEVTQPLQQLLSKLNKIVIRNAFCKSFYVVIACLVHHHHHHHPPPPPPPPTPPPPHPPTPPPPHPPRRRCGRAQPINLSSVHFSANSTASFKKGFCSFCPGYRF